VHMTIRTLSVLTHSDATRRQHSMKSCVIQDMLHSEGVPVTRHEADNAPWPTTHTPPECNIPLNHAARLTEK
jgi:hypothetical protein